MVAARHALVPAPSTMSLILVVKLSVQEKCVYRGYVLAKLSTRKVGAIYGLLSQSWSAAVYFWQGLITGHVQKS